MTATVADASVRAEAEQVGVCVRPIVQRLTDTTTRKESLVSMPCGSTQTRICPSCAARAVKVRQQQAREGWHRTEELPKVDVPHLVGLGLRAAAAKAATVVALSHPHLGPRPVPNGQRTLKWPDVGPLPVEASYVRVVPQASKHPAGTVIAQNPAPGRRMGPESTIRLAVSSGEEPSNGEAPLPQPEQKPTRIQRSTKRRADAPALPKTPRSDRTIGRTLTSPSGRKLNPSMFITATLRSYGPVHTDSQRGCACGQRHLAADPSIGTPLFPKPGHKKSYDYRQAALDAMHFPKLVDHFWRMMRRHSGFDVQYFATIEAQKRLALHMHAAVRGVIPTSLLRQIVAATYVQIWWPPIDQPVYVGNTLPVWDHAANGYVDPDTGLLLDTFDAARANTEEPAHVMWFGEQVDRQWFLPGTKRSEKRIGYLTKYLTKSIAETYDPDTASEEQQAHRDRLAAETRWLPCTPECHNWLRFGVQPRNPKPGMRPGECTKRAHRPDNLGHGGRRVLVSEQWSGKTLNQHRADRARVVKAALAEAGIAMPDQHRCSTTATNAKGEPRYRWKPLDMTRNANAETYRRLLDNSIAERIAWQNEYDDAKLAAAQAAEQAHRAARARPTDRDPRTYRRWVRRSVRQPAAHAA